MLPKRVITFFFRILFKEITLNFNKNNEDLVLTNDQSNY